jgi:hypothetical protein
MQVNHLRALLADIETLEQRVRAGDPLGLQLSAEYLRANRSVLVRMFRVAYVEHTEQERFSELDRSHTALDPVAAPASFHAHVSEILDAAATCTDLSLLDDDLAMLIRGLRFAERFGATAPALDLSPVSRHVRAARSVARRAVPGDNLAAQ